MSKQLFNDTVSRIIQDVNVNPNMAFSFVKRLEYAFSINILQIIYLYISPDFVKTGEFKLSIYNSEKKIKLLRGTYDYENDRLENLIVKDG